MEISASKKTSNVYHKQVEKHLIQQLYLIPTSLVSGWLPQLALLHTVTHVLTQALMQARTHARTQCCYNIGWV